MLGLSKPDEKDETIRVLTPYIANEEHSAELNAAGAKIRGESDGSVVSDIEADYSGDLVPISDEIAEVLEKAADKATDFDSFKAELLRLSSEWSADKIADLMAIAFFSARAKVDSHFEG